MPTLAGSGPRIGNVFLAEFAVEGEALRRLD